MTNDEDRQFNDWVSESLKRIFTPRTPEQIAADDLRYRQMIFRLYNALLECHTRTPFNLDVTFPCHSLWDEFLRLNRGMRIIAIKLEEEYGYQFSERQCSVAVDALIKCPKGPKIEF